jgi:predicted nuclease with RNAse H fold
MKDLAVVGVDLAGVPTRPTGFCLLKGLRADTCLLYSDEDILDRTQQAKPALVAIDAPLTLPPGRETIEERNEHHFRPCDLELRKKHIPFFPITLGPMRQLTERGLQLRARLDLIGFEVVEAYPGGAQDILDLPRVKYDLPGLRRGLRRLGIAGLKNHITDHELDAVTAAYTGLLYAKGEAEVYGDFETGAIIMPPSP